MPVRQLRSQILRARLDIATRAFCLLAGFVLVVTSTSFQGAAGTMLLLIAVGAVMTIWSISGGVGDQTYLGALIAEGAFAVVLVCLSPSAAYPFVIYICAAPLLAGIRGGIGPAVATVTIQTLALFAVRTQNLGTSNDVLSLGGPWLLTGFAVAVLGSWIRQLQLIDETRPSPYAAAHRLLEELRTVTRGLPGGLDLPTTSEAVLRDVTLALKGTRSALLLTEEGQGLEAVAHHGDDRFGAALVGDPIIELSMELHRLMQQPQPRGEAWHRYRTCLPLIVGGRCIGVAVVDAPDVAPPEVLIEVQSELEDSALQLESAQLFGEVRSTATVEERRRLAREIHDGIAQEIASLGYLVDDMSAQEANPEQRTRLTNLRGELTRVVTELRLSIFDLRSGVSRNAGLGSVLSDYVREVGKNAGLAVHVSLEESTSRLRLDVETELLRIAQEAVNNARKHSKASNLWVTCRVEPPFAEVRVEDDGVGSAHHRKDHYGLHSMQERAHRIKAVLTVAERKGGGTTVSTVLLPSETPATTPENGERHALHRAARRRPRPDPAGVASSV
ncbi:MAG: sensor histidine kinase [Nocardioidaceae bacterium]